MRFLKFNWRSGPVALAVSLALIATACGSSSTQTAATGPMTEAESAAAASVLVTTADGGQLDWGSLSGQDVVLWFWAPW